MFEVQKWNQNVTSQLKKYVPPKTPYAYFEVTFPWTDLTKMNSRRDFFSVDWGKTHSFTYDTSPPVMEGEVSLKP